MRDLKHSGRRAFLKTAGGVALGLPLLEYTHGHVFSEDVPATTRFLTVFSHGGTISNMRVYGAQPVHRSTGGSQGVNEFDLWRMPPGTGSRPQTLPLALGELLTQAGLQPFVEKLVQVEGLDNQAVLDKTGRGQHGASNDAALTAAIRQTGIDPDNGKPIYAADGPSIDAVIADRLGTIPVHLAVKDHGYGTPYHDLASNSVGAERDPVRAFDNLFAGVMASGRARPGSRAPQRTAPGAPRRAHGGLRPVPGSGEPGRSARDRRPPHASEHAPSGARAAIQATEACVPPDTLASPDQHGRFIGNVIGPMQVRILIAAIRCGLTRVANLEIWDLVTMWQPGHGGFGDLGHSLAKQQRSISGLSEQAAWLDEMRENRAFRLGLFRQLVEGLDDPSFLEGGRTLLDNSLVLYTSEFSEAAGHLSYNIPVLLAGSAGGCVATGLHHELNAAAQADQQTTAYDTEYSLHNLYTSILQASRSPTTTSGTTLPFGEGPSPAWSPETVAGRSGRGSSRARPWGERRPAGCQPLTGCRPALRPR